MNLAGLTGEFMTAEFWAALGSIVLANIVMSGDNAVVIAMASRSLPPEQQRRAVFWGSAAAIVMRIALTLVAVQLLAWPFVKAIGALLLLYLGVSLLRPEEGHDAPAEVHGTVAAIRTILIADLVMSLDNVLAVAAAAHGQVTLLVIGLAISVPLIVFGSTLLLRVMDRFPAIVIAGAALLGYLSGEMLLTDPALIARFGEPSSALVTAAGAAGAAIVVGVGLWWRRRGRGRSGQGAPSFSSPPPPQSTGAGPADDPAAAAPPVASAASSLAIGSSAGAAPPAAGAPPVAAGASSAGAASTAPVLLGRYPVERELGHGAMGTVYLCRDPASGQALAVKTMALNREFAGRDLDEVRERFFREAELAGRLRHPDIVAIRDAGESHGLAFIAMECARGHDLLRHTLAGRLLPAPVVLRVLARVARALAHAHRQGVVHRDVKPANVIVDVDNGVVNAVKVTDFGIAHIADAARTRTGLVLGTPAFMSPEQLAGDRLDGRTDLYSLGVMGFQLLTGVLPHRSDSMAQLMKQIATEPAPDLGSLRPDLPGALARVLARALEKQPALRHADGDALAAELEAVTLAPEAVSTTAAPPNSTAADTAATGRAERPDSAGFEATQPLTPVDPRHNAPD